MADRMTKISVGKAVVGVLAIALFWGVAGCGSKQDANKPSQSEIQSFTGHKPTDEQLRKAMAQSMGKAPSQAAPGQPSPAAPGQPTTH